MQYSNGGFTKTLYRRWIRPSLLSSVQWGFFGWCFALMVFQNHWFRAGSVHVQSWPELPSCMLGRGSVRSSGGVLLPSQPHDHALGRWSGWLWSGFFLVMFYSCSYSWEVGVCFYHLCWLAWLCAHVASILCRLMLPAWVGYWGQWKRTDLDLSPCWEYLLAP